MSIDATHILQTRDKIGATAHSMLAGDCSYIEGARLICDLLDSARLNRLEQPFIRFVGIASETDDVPVGELRERWHPEAKSRLETEWADAERYAKSCGEPACRQALTWLAANPFEFP